MKFRPKQCPTCEHRRDIAGRPIWQGYKDHCNDSTMNQFVCAGHPYIYHASKERCDMSTIWKDQPHAKNKCPYYKQQTFCSSNDSNNSGK